MAESPPGALGSDPPSRLTDVIRRLRTIEASASRSDGVVCFARLYREVTEGVAAELTGQGFADSQFLATLDIRFADLFFSALESYGRDPTGTPSAWVPLFAQRSRRGVAPLQFALAGMNAHINRDLPVALVTTCHELGLELLDGSREHADFERVDALLGQVEARVKRSYLTGWLAQADRLVHRLRRIDDVVAMWDVDRPETLPGRTRRRCGRCAASRRWPTTTCSRSTGWWVSPVAGSSSLPIPGCSSSAAHSRGRRRHGTGLLASSCTLSCAPSVIGSP